MRRRVLVSRFAEGVTHQFFGRFDYRQFEFDPPEIYYSKGGPVLLDGKQIFGVWLADTDAGVIGTYDVYQLGAGFVRIFEKDHSPSEFRGMEVRSFGEDGILSLLLKGSVELYGIPGVELAIPETEPEMLTAIDKARTAGWQYEQQRREEREESSAINIDRASRCSRRQRFFGGAIEAVRSFFAGRSTDR